MTALSHGVVEKSPLRAITFALFHRTQAVIGNVQLRVGVELRPLQPLRLCVRRGPRVNVRYNDRRHIRFCLLFSLQPVSWVLGVITWRASVLTFFKRPEVVCVSEAATVEEASALVHLAVEEVARYEASARARLILQVAWTLFGFHQTHFFAFLCRLEIIFVALTAAVLKRLTAERLDVEVESVL